MIISHKYQYVFIQLPHTGCTAIAKELRQFYAGQPILRKHSTYHEYLYKAPKGEKNYFAFSGIRNPIDECASIFFKYKSNHERYDNPINFIENNGFVTHRMRRRFRYVQKNRNNFNNYFKKYYYLPYDNYSRLNHRQLDYVYRFENIEHDFTKILELIGIEKKRPLPVRNKTNREGKDLLKLFSPDNYRRSFWVFGPFLRDWDYPFPFNFVRNKPFLSSQILYDLLGKVRSIYWTRKH